MLWCVCHYQKAFADSGMSHKWVRQSHLGKPEESVEGNCDAPHLLCSVLCDPHLQSMTPWYTASFCNMKQSRECRKSRM